MLFDVPPDRLQAAFNTVCWLAFGLGLALAVALLCLYGHRSDIMVLERDIDRLAGRVKGMMRENALLRYRLGLVSEGKLKPSVRPVLPVKPAPEESARGMG